ncbi:unnamed protein product [Protopolystoma xenopodis]|uniref:Uncharacterized protein n=1 Tax=Protopolystoma xenopodis TaxID=117903 RepID=A0A448XJY6_9PLAT|nr:unnamed protein product [Protopolystoma xenopodis]
MCGCIFVTISIIYCFCLHVTLQPTPAVLSDMLLESLELTFIFHYSQMDRIYMVATAALNVGVFGGKVASDTYRMDLNQEEKSARLESLCLSTPGSLLTTAGMKCL